MTDDETVETQETHAIEHSLELVRELETFIRLQDRQQQDAVAESRQLKHVIAAATARLEAMVSGQRASRAELQAVIQDLRSAIGEDGADELKR